MNRSILLLATLSLTIAAGCAKKAETKTAPAADNAAAKEEAIEGARFPNDDLSRSFVERLIRVDAKDFRPTDAGTTMFIYKTIDFKNDNTWTAQAMFSADGESVDCKESGTWEMDKASSEHTAPMTWQLTQSRCPGRPQEQTMRMEVTIEKGEYTVKVR